MTLKINIMKNIKRVNDNDLLKIQKIVNNEVERRLQNDKQNMLKNG